MTYRILRFANLSVLNLLAVGVFGLLPNMSAAVSSPKNLVEMEVLAASARKRAETMTAKITAVEESLSDMSSSIETSRKHSEKPGISAKEKEKWDAWTRVCQANAHKHEKRHYIADGAARKYITIAEDLRDVAGLMREFNIPNEEKMNLSPGKSARIMGYDNKGRYVVGDYNEHARFMSVEAREVSGASVCPVPIQLGIPPVGMFDYAEKNGGKVEEVFIDGKHMVSVSWSTGDTQVAGLFSPELNYSFRKIEVRDSQGQTLRQETAADYRIIDGIPYPFKYDQYERDPETGQMRHTKDFRVEEAQFNVSLTALDLQIQIPKGTQIAGHMKKGVMQNVTTQRDLSLDMITLQLLASGFLQISEYAAEAPADIRDVLVPTALPDSEKTNIRSMPYICEYPSKTVKADNWRICILLPETSAMPLRLASISLQAETSLLAWKTSEKGVLESAFINISGSDRRSRLDRLGSRVVTFKEANNDLVLITEKPKTSVVFIEIEKLGPGDIRSFKKDVESLRTYTRGEGEIIVDCRGSGMKPSTAAEATRILRRAIPKGYVLIEPSKEFSMILDKSKP